MSDIEQARQKIDSCGYVHPTDIKSAKDITKIIDEGFHKVGDIINLIILRNNQELELELELGDPKQNNKGI